MLERGGAACASTPSTVSWQQPSGRVLVVAAATGLSGCVWLKAVAARLAQINHQFIARFLPTQNTVNLQQTRPKVEEAKSARISRRCPAGFGAPTPELPASPRTTLFLLFYQVEIRTPHEYSCHSHITMSRILQRHYGNEVVVIARSRCSWRRRQHRARPGKCRRFLRD
jgi:hypothetical protein